MKIYKKLGLLAIVSMLVMTLVPSVNAATPPAAPVEIRASFAGEESILLQFPQLADNLTYIEYVKYVTTDDTQWAIGEGTVAFNSSTGTSYTLEGLTADTTYYFQAWNRITAQKNTPSGTNTSCSLHLPPASASGSGASSSGGDTSPTIPPADLGADGIQDIPGFELLAFIAALGVCFLIIRRGRII